jgi:hypothetical protein
VATPNAEPDPGRPAGRFSTLARALTDLVAFACELAMLVLLGVSGWGMGNGGLLGIALALCCPALAVLIWTVWIAPRAGRRLADPWRFVVQVVLFGATAAAAVAADKAWWGIAFVCVAVIAFALARVVGSAADAPGSSR